MPPKKTSRAPPKDVCAFCFKGEDNEIAGKLFTSSAINAHSRCMKFNPSKSEKKIWQLGATTTPSMVCLQKCSLECLLRLFHLSPTDRSTITNYLIYLLSTQDWRSMKKTRVSADFELKKSSRRFRYNGSDQVNQSMMAGWDDQLTQKSYLSYPP